MNSSTDEKLMKMFCDGKNEAFQLLYEKYRNPIFTYLTNRFTLNKQTAEDLTQEIFIKLIRNRNSFNLEMVFSTWIYTIARNHCLNHFKKPSYRLEIESDDYHMVQIMPENDKNAHDIMVGGETGDIIRKALNKLPEKQKEIFILKEINNLSYGEIGKILTMKEGAVRTQLHRTKKRLQENLKRLGGTI